MCTEHDPTELGWDDEPRASRSALSRRGFLAAVAGATAVSFAGAKVLSLPSTVDAAVNSVGLSAYRHAMHVHSSFSEGTAALEAQITEAIATGCHVLHPTDHDRRMSAVGAPDAFHFTSSPETVNGKSYSWVAKTAGSLALKSGGLVSSPVSPFDTTTSRGSLRVEAASAGTALASHRFDLDGSRAENNHRTNIGGQTLACDVYLDAAGPDGWAEILLTLSYRPALSRSGGTRRAGRYTISYRLGTQAHSRRTNGTSGIVTLAVPLHQWTTVRLDPTSDAAALWPDTLAADNVLGLLAMGVTSQNRFVARCVFGNLRFFRSQVAGDRPLQSQRDLIAAYAERYPQLQISQGVEISGTSEHANGFFTPRLTDYTQVSPPDLYRYAAELMHAAGGLASINHPFGSGTGALLSASSQEGLRRKVATRLLSRQLCGVDIVETGYRQRSGASLETHLALTATFWRNGYWVTANGVSDNHNGTAGSWSQETNRFFTGVWQASLTPDDAYESLRRGAVFVGELGAFRGSLDLNVDDAQMGMVSVRPELTSRPLTILGLDLPTDATVEVVRGPVDYSGAVDPGTAVVTTVSSTRFATGSCTVDIDTSRSCFVYVTVLNSSGRRVAFSNPIFLLREHPPAARPVPADRQATD